LWNRQLIFVLKSIIQKHHRKIKRMLKPRGIRYVRNALDMAPWSYVPEVYPGRVIYFLSEERKMTSGGSEAAIGSWYELAAGGLDEFHVPGDHLGMLKEPHVQIVAEHLTACLDEAQMSVSDTNHAQAASVRTAE
jgi:thioesterase domain-containing protein